MSDSEQKNVDALAANIADPVIEEPLPIEIDTPEGVVTCDCSYKVHLKGEPGKGYKVLSVSGKNGVTTWKLHGTRQCYKEVCAKIDVANK